MHVESYFGELSEIEEFVVKFIRNKAGSQNSNANSDTDTQMVVKRTWVSI